MKDLRSCLYFSSGSLNNCEPELTEIFKMCLKDSCFPDCWKVSSAVPELTSVGERSITNNYCPISLLSVVRKIFETLINYRLVDHREICGLFSDLQYSFRSSRSTEDFLTVASDEIDGAFDRPGTTRAYST